MVRKKVLVYGANGGLGSAICREFHQNGFDIVLAGRNTEKLLKSKSNLAIPGEIREFSITEEIEDSCLKGIDIIINAAGIDVRKSLVKQNIDEIKKQLELNLFGTINLTKTALKVFRDKGYGQILHLGGFADGAWATPYYTVDVATRAGIYSFIESINLEIDNKNVIVQYFCPLPADTEAERPYHNLWRSMGIRVVSAEKVAKDIFSTIKNKQKVKIMGGMFNTLVSTNLRHLLPGFFTKILLKPMGIRTMKYIDNIEEKI